MSDKISQKGLAAIAVLALVAFLGWRFIRPMNIFDVSESFERPISTADAPALFRTLRAEECAACHQVFFDEWSTSMHSQAWTDPYFQTDWQFDSSQQICKNCHIPLDRQQEHKVLGFRDREKWDPILAPNPDFDPELQHQGVTCTACHLREGKILGIHGITDSPHPVRKLNDPNEICVGCHVVDGDSWDTFFRFPPCGTVAEIRATTQSTGRTGEVVVQDTADLGCVQCHMPAIERPLVEGGTKYPTRQHLWRGGHDPEMVKKALRIELTEQISSHQGTRTFTLTLVNVGAAHYVPTGTPDRHLTVHFRLLDAQDRLLSEQKHTLVRTLLWRPFIIDLWDTRLPLGEPRTYTLEIPTTGEGSPAVLEAVVRYHLLAESRRKRIGYDNQEPIAYEVFKQRVRLTDKDA